MGRVHTVATLVALSLCLPATLRAVERPSPSPRVRPRVSAPALPYVGGRGRTVMDTDSPLFHERLTTLSAQRDALRRQTARMATRSATPSLRAMLRWRQAEEAAGPGASPGAVGARFDAASRAVGDRDATHPTPAVLGDLRRRFAYYWDPHPYHDTQFALATPAIPPLLRAQLRQLRGEKPFARHRVLFVGHGYSDAVPWVETFVEAGADPLRTVFVPTNYGFHTAVAEQLTFRGVLVHDFAMGPIAQPRYERVVEAHLRQLLHDARRDDDPVLILDDGGVATRLVAEKFAKDAHRVTIVEQTDQGHRQADALRDRLGKLPFMYYSMARTRLKREVTSPRFAERVVDRTYAHLQANGLVLAELSAAVIGGGGAMGLPAAKRLRADGFRVRVIEKDLDSDKAKRARDAGFEVVTMDGGRALAGHALVVGMSGETVLGAAHMAHVDDGTVFVQGSSKAKEFDMADLERGLHKLNSPFSGMPTSMQYVLGNRQFHFIKDGWTVNHANTFHGVQMRELQLELATYFETALAAVRAPRSQVGGVFELPERRQRVLERYDATTRAKIPEYPTPPSVNPFDRVF